ncbi:MAG: 23S rRNA (pseudouridine(1915)-N(3))-methyltransferase RlmH [Chitinispirillales bacterium]|jgi:23S rRNA (pseudouridine1915-N3)-methyltransferase|nr:23S rRNA (pseudouridine(1915)-N(3))-methyltransferase RlmH [Chitinispirillales bacterium]
MNIKIAAAGKIKDKFLLEKIRDYGERISHDCRIEIVEIKDCGVESEGAKFLDLAARNGGTLVTLTEEGTQYSSKDFSTLLENLGARILFVIGGPDGVSPSVKSQSRVLLSLSKMTFTHEMARMFLLEQIYRAISIKHNRKYHRGN